MPRRSDTTIGVIDRIKDLTGGVNLRPSPTNIQPNQSRRLIGGLVSSPGELAMYPGHLTFSTTSLGNRRLQGGKRIYLSSVNAFTLGADNGSVYKPSDLGVWGASVLSGLHATNAIDFVYDRDIVAVFDGSNVPKKSKDAVTWTQLGITAPAAPTLALVAGGSLVNGNTYEISYAYVDSSLSHPSNATATAEIAVTANQTIRVTVSASASADVDQIKIYARDKTAGETVRRLTATISNVSTTHDITTNNWDAQEEAPTDHNPSVAMKFGWVWKNRWWGVDATVANRLRFSQIFQNQSWSTLFFVDIPFDRGESIRGGMPIGDVCVVFGDTKFYLIIGQTSLDFEVRPALNSQTGAFGFRAIDLVESGVVHAGPPGLYIYNGASDDLLTDPIDPAWTTMVDTATQAELQLLPIAYHKQSKELHVAVPDLYPTGARGEWVLDLRRTRQEGSPVWMSTVRTVGGYIQWDGSEPTVGSQGRMFSWSPTLAKLFEERSGTSADGGNRILEYDGFMLPFTILRTRLVDSYIEYQPCQGTLTVNLKVGGKLMGEQSFDTGVNLSRYGSATYGVSTYTGDSDRAMLPVVWPIEAEGLTAQLLLKYVGLGDFKVFSYGHNHYDETFPRGF